MKTRCEWSFFIDSSNIVVITVVLKIDHTSEKNGNEPLKKGVFLRFKQQIPISVLLKKRGNKLFTKGVYLSELSFFLLL